ncbi:MAG: trimethylamine methyltransferase family protein, partial [Planctomycetota bacterium]|jgi:trimethylamine--corrinoid protein Co-methyltransferase
MCADSQAAMEKMFGIHTHMENGVSAIWGMGQLESELTFSPAQAVIDNEMIAYARRYQRGIEVNDETLAVELSQEVGIAGSFLETMHTAENFREELFMPDLLWRSNRSNWTAEGSKDISERAEEKAKKLTGVESESFLGKEEVGEFEKIIGL